MTLLGLTGLFNFLSSAGLAWVVIIKCPRRDWARAYGFLNTMIAIFSLSYVIWQCQTTAEHGLFPMQLLTGSAMWINPALLYFVFVLRGDVRSHRSLLGIITFINIIFTAMDFNGWLFGGLEPRHGLGFWPIITPWFIVYLIFWHAELICAFVYLWLARSFVSDLRKEQLNYLLIAFGIGYCGGITNWPLWFNINIPPYPNILITAYVSIVAYAMIQHRLMDIRIVIRKTLAYSIVSALLAAVYAGIITVLARSFEQWTAGTRTLSSAIAACVITLLFDPLRRRLEWFLDRRFGRAREALREMSSSFAHEVKTPLARIALPAELTYRELEPLESSSPLIAKARERLHYIMEQALLAGRRMEALQGLMETWGSKHETIQMMDVIQASRNALHDLTVETGVEMTTTFPPDFPSVLGNAQQLDIVCVNLIKNALEALAGRVDGRLTITGTRHKDEVVICFQDNGPGLTDIAHLFEPYVSTKGGQDRGMGLYLCKSIIKAHHGEITAANHPSGGAVFCIRLPSES